MNAGADCICSKDRWKLLNKISKILKWNEYQQSEWMVTMRSRWVAYKDTLRHSFSTNGQIHTTVIVCEEEMNWAFKEGKLLEDYGTWHHQSRGKFIRHHQFRSFFFVCPLVIAEDENFFHLCSYAFHNVYAWFPFPLLLLIIIVMPIKGIVSYA